MRSWIDPTWAELFRRQPEGERVTCEQQIGWAAHLPGGFEFRTHERGAARCCVVERQYMHGGEQAHHLAMLALGLAAFRDSGEKLIGRDRRACRKSGSRKDAKAQRTQAA